MTPRPSARQDERPVVSRFDSLEKTGSFVVDPAVRRRVLVAVIASISIYGVTLSLVIPLLSLILEGRGIDGTVIGLLAAAPAIGTLVFSPFIPAFIARFEMRRFLWASIALEAALIVAIPLLDSLLLWFVIRFLTGATGAGLFVASETWINEIADDRSRGRIMGIYTTTIGASFALGPAILAATGSDSAAPFVVAAAFICVAAVPLLWTGDSVPYMDEPPSFSVWSFAAIAPTMVAAVLLMSFKESAAMSLLPVYGVRRGLSDAGAASMLTASAVGIMVLPFIVGWFADHFDRYRVISVCAITGAISTLTLPWSVGHGLAMWMLLFIWGGVFAGVYTVAMAIVGQRFRGTELATANAAFGVFWGVGSMIGPMTAGVAMDIWNPNGFPAILTCAVGGFLVVLVRRRRD